jgi:hypothetical protein
MEHHPADDKLTELDDTGLITMGRKVYHSPLPSLYTKPKVKEDLLDGCDWLYHTGGKAVHQHKEPLSPRTDKISFDDDQERYKKELEKNLDLSDCPVEFHTVLKEMIIKYWDCFTEDGLRTHIRSFEFAVDTGESAPIASKPPQYGPHKGHVIMQLVKAMELNGIMDHAKDHGQPWWYSYHDQAKVPWFDYSWRLCISYRCINRIMRPYAYPIPRCANALDDILKNALDDIPPSMAFFISFDLATGYWQIKATEATKEKLAFHKDD